MFRISSLCAAIALLLSQGWNARAFSLFGPFDERFQTDFVGYNLAGDIGGPMNLGEEYRFSSPVVTYGYDKTFLDYFGQAGVDAIEGAMAILNGVPAASAMTTNLTEFPLGATRVNFQAAALQAYDMKSIALTTVLQQMGVGAPTRWTYALQAAEELPPDEEPLIWQFAIIMRNFDPVTLAPSAYINEVLHSWRTVQISPDPDFDVLEVPVDPLLATLRNPISSGSEYFIGPGEYYTGLTRDDAGALRYIYNPRNLNAEDLPVNTTNALGAVFTGGTGGSGSPWGFPTGGSGGSGLPFDSPFIGLTNIFTNIAFTNIVGGGFGAGLVNAGVRAGVDKVTFQRMDNDNPFGLFNGVTNRWLDVFFTNNGAQIIMVEQAVERVSGRPDILFGANNLFGDANFPQLLQRTTAAGWDNNADINSDLTGIDAAGPGTIDGPIDIVFTSVGPFEITIDVAPVGGGADSTEAGQAFPSPFFVWGSFDGSSRPPILFPIGTSIQEIENRFIAQ